MFRARHEADYGEVEWCDADAVAAAIVEAEQFIQAMRTLLGSASP